MQLFYIFFLSFPQFFPLFYYSIDCLADFFFLRMAVALTFSIQYTFTDILKMNKKNGKKVHAPHYKIPIIFVYMLYVLLCCDVQKEKKRESRFFINAFADARKRFSSLSMESSMHKNQNNWLLLFDLHALNVAFYSRQYNIHICMCAHLHLSRNSIRSCMYFIEFSLLSFFSLSILCYFTVFPSAFQRLLFN